MDGMTLVTGSDDAKIAFWKYDQAKALFAVIGKVAVSFLYELIF
jgi:hypothetical protein